MIGFKRLALPLLLSGAVSALPAEAAAEITVRFEERTDHDRFHIINMGSCLVTVMGVTIDLGPTAGSMVFDTGPDGGGVNAFRPLALHEGADRVRAVRGGEDGSRQLGLDLHGLREGERIVLSIDVDDQLAESPWGQTLIAGPEIDGGSVTATLRRPDGSEWNETARFGPDAEARFSLRSCAIA